VDAEVDVAEHRLRVPHARDVVEQEPRRRGPKRRHVAGGGGSGAAELDGDGQVGAARSLSGPVGGCGGLAAMADG
jgi:hypothetical protein